MHLDVQKDAKKMYFVLFEGKARVQREIDLYLKQATQVLMYCHNDFRRFVAEILCIKHGKVTFKDINRTIERLAGQNAQMISNGLLPKQLQEG